jgi:hypothetical protein
MIDSAKRERIFARQDWTCDVCGGPVIQYGTPQIAHGIAKTEGNLKVYGEEVVDHEDALHGVCSLRCNDACNIGHRPEEARALAERIKGKLQQEHVQAMRGLQAP